MTSRALLERDAARLFTLLHELVGSPVARREFRYQPERALAERGWCVPPPSSPLPVRITGLSVWLSPESLFGRDPSSSEPPPPWMDSGLLLFAFGERPAALLHLEEEAADRLARFARSRGWVAVLGPHALTPVTDPLRAQFADLAASVRPAVPGTGDHRTVFLARDFDRAAVGWLSLLFGWDSYLGTLLGYPECCTSAFPKRWARAQELGSGDVAAALLEEAGPDNVLAIAAACNSSVRVLGAQLPLHFPCSLSCVRTIEQVGRQLEMLETVDPPRGSATRELLEAVTLVSKRGEVTVLPGARVEDDILSFDPKRLRSSSPTQPDWSCADAGRIAVSELEVRALLPAPLTGVRKVVPV